METRYITSDATRDYQDTNVYENMCCSCKRIFLGHRGRVVCLACASRKDSSRFIADFEEFVESLKSIGLDGRQPAIAAAFREGYARGENKAVGEFVPQEDLAFAEFVKREFDETIDYSLGKWASQKQADLWKAWYSQKDRMTQLFTNGVDKAVTAAIDDAEAACKGRFESLMADNKISEGNEALKCSSAVRHIATRNWLKIKDWL